MIRGEVYVWHVHTRAPNPEGVYHAPGAAGRTECGLETDDEPFGGRGTKGWASRRQADEHGAKPCAKCFG